MNFLSSAALLCVLAVVGCQSWKTVSTSTDASGLPQLTLTDVSTSSTASQPDPAPVELRPSEWYDRLGGTGAREPAYARFKAPARCTRKVYEYGSFSDWVQNLPLAPIEARSLDYKGEPIAPRVWAAALIDMNILPPGRDLQQCADYALRLTVEYAAKFCPDEKLDWKLQSGSPHSFRARGDVDKLLTSLFSSIGTHGLKTQFESIGDEYRPGDVVVGNSTGGIGHAVVIHDVYACPEGDRYLVSQSWMPAQTPYIADLHVVPGDPFVTAERIREFLSVVTGDPIANQRRLPGCRSPRRE